MNVGRHLRERVQENPERSVARPIRNCILKKDGILTRSLIVNVAGNSKQESNRNNVISKLVSRCNYTAWVFVPFGTFHLQDLIGKNTFGVSYHIM